MANKTRRHADLNTLTMLPHESLYIGVDIGKFKHVAGFVSKTLLERHKHFEQCPAFLFEQSREGFRAFVERIRAYCPLEQCFLLMEQTGHFHKTLQQYLLELDIPVYVMHVQCRDAGMIKTDKRDALGLANQLYNQLELGVQVCDKLQVVHRTIPPSEAAAQLKGLMHHRYELANEATQRKNKLTAICDELFPELTQVLKNPNSPTALDLREKFPTPQAVATASLITLREIRRSSCPSEAQLVLLQQLAAQSIGTKDVARQRGLVLEQSLLIKELRLMQEHMERLDMEVTQIVEHCREGQILLSIPPISPICAAAILATIGHIANFEDAGHLKSYFGWAPKSVLDSQIGSHWSPEGQPKWDPPEKFGHCKCDPPVVEITPQWCSFSSHSTRFENTDVFFMDGSLFDYPFAGSGSHLYCPVVPNCIVLNTQESPNRSLL